MVDLEGRSVILVHPAWHSCGSFSVFCGQTAAYRALGARVLSLAVGHGFSQGSRHKRFWNHYYRMTPALHAHERYHTGPSRRFFLNSRMRHAATEAARSNYAHQIAASAELSPIPKTLLGKTDVALIHCNHYFNMPLAVRLGEHHQVPIVLDTHDVQAFQFALRGAKPRFSKAVSSTEAMLQTELQYLRQANALLHLNNEEYEFFRMHLPDRSHHLLYPTLVYDETPLGEAFFLIVASANYPNYQSVEWFLDRVFPFCGPINVRIVGNVDEEVRNRSPALYARHKNLFEGRVERTEWYYDQAIAVLIPCVSGHGLSIKTVEALASGQRIVATPRAFRGMALDPAGLDNVQLCSSAAEFAAAVRVLHAASLETICPPKPNGTGHRTRPPKANGAAPNEKHLEISRRLERKKAATAQWYVKYFSLESYALNLSNIVSTLR